ncbi:MAG TPA: mannose-1-phosphate guanylyltransferase/mannose-6-phosphate isomerase [Rhizomicrobium sp.]|nr:mannose-1-phosphate guanylyltransferase/mannose-6-phosphate isomerase [Rhizomicrobium sp.]
MAEFAFYPAILSGGTGSRLWPLSRAALPKQLLALAGERTMIQETVLRAALPGAASPLLICNDEHRFLVAEQMREIGVKPSAIVLEPMGRNTAPAAAVAALKTAERQADGIVLLLPSDHVVTDAEGFARALAIAIAQAAKGDIVTFGIRPSRPETGYGYIETGKEIAPGAFAVARFTEKPDAATAQAWLAGGRHLWNSGMFVFRADVLIGEMEEFAPEVLAGARAALAAAKGDLDFVRLDKDAFARAPEISIDYAVMERTKRAAVVPADFGWSDVGSWAALWELAPRDEADNALSGDVLMEDSQGCYVRAEKGVAAVVGVEDLVVVVTGDAVLVAKRDRAQDVKAVVEKLKARGGEMHLNHPKVFRPWGSFESVDRGARHQVKQIVVKPGERLSLQMHHHRAEHWVVVEGVARVTRDDETFLLNENESVFIPQGAKHRLENPGPAPLRLIEVQSGSYLGEDDIVRFEDSYGRK